MLNDPAQSAQWAQWAVELRAFAAGMLEVLSPFFQAVAWLYVVLLILSM